MRHVCQFFLTLGHAGGLWMSAFECFLYLDTLPMWRQFWFVSSSPQVIILSAGLLGHVGRELSFIVNGYHTLYGVASSISWVATVTTPWFCTTEHPLFVRIPFFGGKYSPRILSGFSFLGLEIQFFCGPGRCLQFQCAVSRLLLSSNLWLNSFFHRRRCDGVLCGLFGIAVQGTDPRMPFDLVRTLWLDVTRYFWGGCRYVVWWLCFQCLLSQISASFLVSCYDVYIMIISLVPGLKSFFFGNSTLYFMIIPPIFRHDVIQWTFECLRASIWSGVGGVGT